MSINNLEIKTASNVQSKLPVFLVLDSSSSMQGNPIKSLNEALQQFLIEVKEDPMLSQRLEISIIEFNSQSQVLLESKLPTEIDAMPLLEASGSTKLQAGITTTLDLVERRKHQLRQQGATFYRPMVMLISDGAPDSRDDLAQLAEKIKQETNSKKYVFLNFGVGEADMSLLQSLNGYVKGEQLQALKLINTMKFSDLFKWLSDSAKGSLSSGTDEVVLSAVNGNWATGFTA